MKQFSRRTSRNVLKKDHMEDPQQVPRRFVASKSSVKANKCSLPVCRWWRNRGRKHLGLSENSVALNPLDYHHFPYHLIAIWGYAVFSDTPI